MNSAKVTILEETLEKKFDIEQFKKFTREFFNELEMYLQQNRQTSIWKEYSDYISAYYKVGKYIDCDDKEIGIIAVELKEEKSVERARSMQRNFVSKVLDDNSLDAAIVAFYSESEASWRLSFVRLDYTFTEKGLTEELTPAKRYSYLVGEKEPIHTAKAQLLPIFENDMKNPTLDEIEEAFSVETVTKEFFNEYKEKYLEVKEYLESNEEFIKEAGILKLETAKFSEQFAKKLMGQLAFLYFLQKKGWLGVGIVPKTISRSELIEVYKTVDDTKKEILKKVYLKINEDHYRIDSDLLASDEFNEHQADHLSDIFIESSKYNKLWGTGNKAFVRDVLWKHCEMNDRNFFDQYLEPFFYEALNNRRKNQYFKSFNSKIPFLNGGLFEPLEEYHWKDTDFEIPNEIFSNQNEKGRKSDGILDIFDRYNFTINENEPLEKDVAVDPEMLGKIFENLLDVKDRKSKGAFYTPREIVHYMCQESLINYLVNEVDVPYEDMKEFILYGEIIRDADSRSGVGYGKEFTIKQSIFDNIVAIDNALENVKVADPAVGSGAFPLGMLNEITRARDNITEYIIRKDKEGEFDRRFGEEFIRERRSSYKIKWDTIKNSIFAVDIEPSAVDITKLRLWLSVVVDQKIEDEIKGPHQLPNLDMNIHVGNSLIDEFEGIKLFDETILTKIKNDGKEESTSGNNMQLGMLVDNTEEIIKEMFELQDKYFNEEGEEKKKDIKKDIENKQEQLIRYKLYEDQNKEGLKKYDESLKNKTKPYFIWELEFARVFKEKGGFDIVVGNPPYIEFKKLDIRSKEIFKKRFESANGKYDIYIIFIEFGINILNKCGTLCYINPTMFMKRDYGKSIRNYIIENCSIREIIDFSDKQMFKSATTYTGIFLYEKSIDILQPIQYFLLERDINIETEASLDILLNSEKFTKVEKNQNELEEVWNFNNELVSEIINKVRKNAKTLGEISESIFQGIASGKDEVFYVTDEIKLEYELEYEILKKIYKGKDIKKYKSKWSGYYSIYPYKDNERILENELKSLYPNIYSYLTEKKELLKGRGYFDKSSKLWYELWNNRDSTKFEKDIKIITAEINKENNFCIDLEKIYGNTKIYTIILKSENKDDYYYILGLLNSKVLDYIYKKISVPKAGGFYAYKKQFMELLPIIELDYKNDLYKEVVRYTKKLSIEYDEETENKLNLIIYKIYGLNDDEISIIEVE